MVKKTNKKRRITKKIIKKKTSKKILRKPAKKLVRKAQKPVKAPRKTIAPASLPQLPKQKLVGVVTHFYPNISVGVVEVKKDIRLGDTVMIIGHGRSFEQKVYSMQYEHQPLKVAKKGQLIGMKTAKEVKEKDLIYLK